MKNKNILVGVTGSIAIYKTLELIRLYIKSGANVKVVMSEEAKKFITPLTFEAISQNEVLHINSERWAKSDSNHIYAGKWADIFVIAPVSANTINKIANGIADNLLLSTVLAFNKKIILAPSANTNMLLNPITQESLKKLESLGFIMSEAQSKLLACNDVGKGAMSEPKDIFDVTLRELTCKEFWQDKSVIITGGGTVEKIDDVRCLTNFSSGKMATSLARAFYYAGAKVTLITSKPNSEIPVGVHVKTYENSNELKSAIEEELSFEKKYLFMASAVSDYIPYKQSGKLKKEDIGNEWNLKLTKNIDILASLDKTNLITIGFKAEMDEQTALENAQNMLKNKNLDAVCLNILKEDNSFGSDKNSISFITNNDTVELELDSKLEISKKIVELSQNLC